MTVSPCKHCDTSHTLFIPPPSEEFNSFLLEKINSEPDPPLPKWEPVTLADVARRLVFSV